MIHINTCVIDYIMNIVVNYREAVPETKPGCEQMWFDIGANIGKWSMANIQSCDTIIALEPDPDTFIRLQHHTRDHPNIQSYSISDNTERSLGA